MGIGFNRLKNFLKRIGIELPHWSSLLIWSLGFIAMFGLTLNYLFPMVNDYLDFEKNMAVQIWVNRNDTIKTPQIFLCLPRQSFGSFDEMANFLRQNQNRRGLFGAECEACDTLTNRSWDVWNQYNITDDVGTEFDPKLKNAILDKIFSDWNNFTDDIYKNGWEKPIVDGVMKIYEDLNEIDVDIYGKRHLNFNPQPLLNRSDENLEQLFEQVARHFCEEDLLTINVEINYHAENYYDCLRQIFEQGSNRLSDHLQFCFPLPEWKYAIGEKYFDQYTLKDNIHIFTENPVFQSDQLPPLLTAVVQDRKSVSVTIQYSLQTKVLEKRDHVEEICYNDSSKADCLVRCKTQKIIDACSCVPFTTRFFVRDIGEKPGFCTTERYENCTEAARAKFAECDKTCTYACEYNFYQWQGSAVYQDDPRQTFFLEIQPKLLITPHLEFIIYRRDGPENLISAIGGLFNFYLGISGLSVIFVVVFLLDSYRHYRKQENNNETSGAAIFPIGLQWRWLTATTAASINSKDFENMKSKVENLEKSNEELRKIVDELTHWKATVGGVEGMKITSHGTGSLKEHTQGQNHVIDTSF